jgi:hypothetical protein
MWIEGDRIEAENKSTVDATEKFGKKLVEVQSEVRS